MKMKLKKSKPMYICIEGNIGAGKTTLAIELAKKWNAQFLAESYADNPLLPLFYKNKKKMAFPLEYSFLIDRHAQLHNYFKTKKKNSKTIADFSIYKCLWFAKTNLIKKEYALYKKHFKTIEEVTPAPDLIIYINTHHSNLLGNIKKRGRSFESTIDKKYLQSVTKSYQSGLSKLTIPVIEFEIETYNSKTNTFILKALDIYFSKNIKQKYCKVRV